VIATIRLEIEIERGTAATLSAELRQVIDEANLTGLVRVEHQTKD
jgi:hypothetical protein